MAIDPRDPNYTVPGTTTHGTVENRSMADKDNNWHATGNPAAQEKRGARNATPLIIGVVVAAIAVMALLSFGASNNNDQMTTGTVNPPAAQQAPTVPAPETPARTPNAAPAQ